MPMISLNDLLLSNANINEKKYIISKPTKSVFQQWFFTSNLRGEEESRRYNDLNGKVIDFEIIGASPSMRARFNNLSSSHNGLIDADTLVHVNFIVTQLDPDLPEEHNLQAQSYALQIQSMLQIDVLIVLMIEKDVFTQDEWDTRLRAAANQEPRENKLSNQLFYGLLPKVSDSSSKPKKDASES